MLRWAMIETIDESPDELLSALTFALKANSSLIRDLARKPKHIPADEQYLEIAQRLVQHIKRCGVEKVVRGPPRRTAFHPARSLMAADV